MEGLRAKARRLLREIIGIVAPRMDFDELIDELVDTIIEAAIDEAARRIASKLATGA